MRFSTFSGAAGSIGNVPSMYDVSYDGPYQLLRPRFPDVPAVVDKRTVTDLTDWPGSAYANIFLARGERQFVTTSW